MSCCRRVKQITEDAVASISAADWAMCCNHVQAVEQSYWETSIAREKQIKKFIIGVNSSVSL